MSSSKKLTAAFLLSSCLATGCASTATEHDSHTAQTNQTPERTYADPMLNPQEKVEITSQPVARGMFARFDVSKGGRLIQGPEVECHEVDKFHRTGKGNSTGIEYCFSKNDIKRMLGNAQIQGQPATWGNVNNPNRVLMDQMRGRSVKKAGNNSFKIDAINAAFNGSTYEAQCFSRYIQNPGGIINRVLPKRPVDFDSFSQCKQQLQLKNMGDAILRGGISIGGGEVKKSRGSFKFKF